MKLGGKSLMPLNSMTIAPGNPEIGVHPHFFTAGGSEHARAKSMEGDDAKGALPGTQRDLGVTRSWLSI
jgi:hypothetical protein